METMTAIGGAILSASFDVLLDRLMSSIDLLKYFDQGQVQAELKKWESMLKRIYAVLDDAEEKQLISRSVKMWVSDLKDLAFNVEDVLDELATEAERRKLKEEPIARANKVQKICSTISVGVNLNTFKLNIEMISKIENISSKLDEIMKQKDGLHLGECITGKISQVKQRLPTTSLVNEAKVYGREKDKEEILQRLKSEASDADVSVIPIVGMGGVGKTTLAQLVFNDVTLEFDLKAWVYVGEDFGLIRMTKAILQSVGEASVPEDFNLLQTKLKQKLSGRKFFVVLDDVWAENYEQWTLFYSPFVVGAPGSKILITTRSQNIASMMGTTPAYSLRELSYENCLYVFVQHALNATNFGGNSDLEDIGKEIVKKCQGLPLAAKVLGGLLRGKRNCNEWKILLNSEIWNLPNDSNVLPALRLSYVHLPSHLKQCFAYCAIFPKDYEFDKNELVLLWMAEGFLYHPEKTKQENDLGHQYFHDLLSRSFFQPSSNQKSLYVMHDLIHDLARSVGGEICFHLGDKLEEAKSYARVRYSSFTHLKYESLQTFEVFYEMKSLRTFLKLPAFHGNIDDCIIYPNLLSGEVLNDMVPKLKRLRVLSLTNYRFKELPSSISALKHLRYLNLAYSTIESLPESVGELLNLQTLILFKCQRLNELPVSICNLIKLQHLDISGTDDLKEMPLQIGNLTNLHSLTKFIVGRIDGLGITELKKFSHLQGRLCITGLENVVDFHDAEIANLKQKQGLFELELEWVDDFYGSRNPSDEVQVLDSLQPHQNVSSLSIISYGGSKFPLWIADITFLNMVQLELCNCRYITSLPPVGQLQSLKELNIEGMDRIEQVGVEFYGDGSSSLVEAFPCLETLRIKNMKMWKQWSWPNGGANAVQFPVLREFVIEDCSKLVGTLPSCLPSIKKLHIQECWELVKLPEALPSLQKLHIADCQEAVIRSGSNLTSLNSLRIENISGLVNLQEILLQTLSLEDVQIEYCDELQYLWRDGIDLDKLACLKHLEIRSCPQLVSLVDGEEGFLPCNLEYLSLVQCYNLKKLPNGLHSLTSLRDLKIRNCGELMAFPATGLPYSLKQISIKCCDSLQSLLGEINQIRYDHIEKLEIRECPSLRSFLPSGEFPNSLKIFKIHDSKAELSSYLYHGLCQLTELEIGNCPQLQSFPERELPISTLISLKISNCKNLKSLPNQMQTFKSLRFLFITNCPQLELFPEGNLPIPALICLYIKYCEKLRSLPTDMKNLKSLSSLYIGNCSGLVSLTLEGLPTNLTKLWIQECKNLAQPMSQWGLHRLASLKELVIKGTSPSTNIVSFPEDSLLFPTSLVHLRIQKLENLKYISRDLQKLTSLVTLMISDCPKLHSLPKQGLSKLGYFGIKTCPLLEQLCSKDKGEYWPIVSQIPCFEIAKNEFEMLFAFFSSV